MPDARAASPPCAAGSPARTGTPRRPLPRLCGHRALQPRAGPDVPPEEDQYRTSQRDIDCINRLTAARLGSPRSPKLTGSDGHPVVALLLRLSCAALLAWIGYILLHLWQEGYRQIPTDGPLFLLAAAARFILASVLLAWPRPLAGLLAAGYTASTLGAMIVSFTVGLFGFRESISASYVVQSLTIETITMLALIGWTALAASHPQLATRARHSPLAGGTVCCLAPGPETRPAADGLS